MFQARPERISCGLVGFKTNRFTTDLRDEDSSPLLGAAPLGESHPSGDWAAGAKGARPPCCYPEARPRGERRAGSGEAQHLHAPPPAAAHVHGSHGNPRHVQVHQHGGVLPGVCCGHHREFHSAEDHLQEQVHAQRAEHPDRQPGAWRPAAHRHRHSHQRLQGEQVNIMFWASTVFYSSV